MDKDTTVNLISSDRQSMTPPVTPSEIRSTIEELNALVLHTVANKVPEDDKLRLLARMTEPILSMALDLHDIMRKNKECCIIFHEWTMGEESIDAGNSGHEERLLH